MQFIIFGTGSYYRTRKRMYLSMNIVCFLDNDITKRGKKIDGYDIDVPSNIGNYNYDYVVIASTYYESIRKQLRELGVPDNKIIDEEHGFGGRGFNYIEKYEFPQEESGKRILFVSHAMNTSGAPTVLLRVAQILKSNGYRVKFVAPIKGGDGTFLYDVLDRQISIDLYQDIGEINIECIEENYDLVFVNTIVLYSFIAKMAGRKVPVIWWLHEEKDVYETHNITREKLVIGNNINVYTVGWRAKTIFESVSEKMANELVYGIPKVKAEKKVDRSKVIFGIVGEFSKRKGQALLCEVVKKNSDRWAKEAEFWVVGYISDEDKKKYEKYDGIKCYGLVTKEKLDSLYEGFDVLVCPSENDPMPASVTDALMRKKLCIVSNMTGQSRYINQCQNGLICEANNEESLEECIQWVLDNKEKIGEVGEEGYLIYENNFTMEKFEENLLSIVNSLC